MLKVARVLAIVCTALLLAPAHPGCEATAAFRGAAYASFPAVPGRSWSALELQFRSARPDGILVFAEHSTQLDFFSLELADGRLCARMQLGDGVVE